MIPSLSPEEAWQPLPEAAWNAEAARHLLRRAGWTASQSEAESAARDGLARTLDRLFPPQPILLPMPESIAVLEQEAPPVGTKFAGVDPDARRAMERRLREREQAALLDLTMAWLRFAAQPENAAFEKWVLFLSDVYVVAFDKVHRPSLLYRHFDLIARCAFSPAPELAKAVSRSPAMVMYLDLAQNRRGAPNENFARELFELFLLGEGNYTEKDIKESARAFTGYRVRPPGEFAFAPREHDYGPKTVFGRTGDFSGDEVIDLAFELPAAGAFLPHEMTKFYLSDDMIPPAHLLALGAQWRAAGYDLRWLALRFFGSRLFYAPEFRGNFIKSPVQFYLALNRDLGIDGVPLPRYVVNPLRQMGQVLYNPPNVRGWVGGRNWINSGSLAARRALVESAFVPLNDENVNADERLLLEAARADGRGRFTVAAGTLERLAGLDAEEAARTMTGEFLPLPASPAFAASLGGFIAGGRPDPREHFRRVRRALTTVLESPDYQLC